MSQCDLILRSLKEGDRLTPMDALIQFQTMRLPARILDLKRKGYRIQRDMILTPTGKRVAQYYLEDV